MWECDSMNRWLKMKDFCTKYGVNTSMMYTHRTNKRIEEVAFKINVPFKNRVLVDTEYFERRMEFKLAVMQYNQDRYWAEITKGKLQFHYAKELAKALPFTDQVVNHFLSYNLCGIQPSNILDYKISPLHWAMYRYLKRNPNV